jgi:hypothetical protein
MLNEVKTKLIELANKYEISEFVNEDPSQFLRWYSDVCDVEVASFIAAIENNHTLTQDWDEYPSFMSVCERYNEAFFENQSLLVIAVFDGTSSADYSVCGVFADKALTVALNRKSSAGGNSLLASWFITVALDKNIVQQASAIEAIVYR